MIHQSFSQVIMKILNLIIPLANIICFQYVAGMKRHGKEPESSKSSSKTPSKILKVSSHSYESMKYIARDIEAITEELKIMTRNLAGITDTQAKEIYRDSVQDLKQKLRQSFEAHASITDRPLSKDWHPYSPGSQMKKLKRIFAVKGIDWDDVHNKMKDPGSPSASQFWIEFGRKEDILFPLVHRAELEYNRATDGEDKEKKYKTFFRLKNLLEELRNDEDLVTKWNVSPYHMEPFKTKGNWEEQELKNIIDSHKKNPEDQSDIPMSSQSTSAGHLSP